MNKEIIEIPDAPEAPAYFGSAEAAAWESGWASGFEAALAKFADDRAAS